MLRRIVSIVLVIGILITVLSGTAIFAAAGLSITNFAFTDDTCASVTISITIVDYVYYDASVGVEIFRNSGSAAAGLLAAYPSGSVTDTFEINAVSGDSVTATATLGTSFSANAGPIVCGGSSTSSGGGSNPGATDGRIGYVPDEYYTLYCAHDELQIWRGVPTGLMLHTVPLLDLLNLSSGEVLDVGGGTTIVRDGGDAFTVYGSDGNLAPQAGSKSFSMAECSTRNGGSPQPQAQTGGGESQNPATTNPDCAANPLAAGCGSTAFTTWCGAVLPNSPACGEGETFISGFAELATQCCMFFAGGVFSIGIVIGARRRSTLKHLLPDLDARNNSGKQ